MKIVALILPPIIDIINSKISNSQVRFLVAFLVCAIIGLIINYTNNLFKFNVNAIPDDILSVFAISQISYQVVYKDSGFQQVMRG